MRRERAGWLVTVNLERQEVMGAAPKHMPLMKKSGIRESYPPFRDFEAGKGLLSNMPLTLAR